jgi:hypothetical protein
MFMFVSRRYERLDDRHVQQTVLGLGRDLRRRRRRGRNDRRLVHHAEIVALKGDSYRLCDRDLARPERRPNGTLSPLRHKRLAGYAGSHTQREGRCICDRRQGCIFSCLDTRGSPRLIRRLRASRRIPRRRVATAGDRYADRRVSHGGRTPVCATLSDFR